MTTFIFGGGYSAQAFARQHHGTIYATTRQPGKFAALERCGITPLLFQCNASVVHVYKALEQVQSLIIAIAPDDEGDPVLRTLDLLPAMPNLQWIAYLSTVGVYGDHQGQWIDETTPCLATMQRSKARLLAEEAWQSFAAKRGVPIAILRLAGIYGPGRNILQKLANNQARLVIKPGQVFNRIHCDDIAGVLEQFEVNRTPGLYNLADDHPAAQQDVVCFAATLMQCALPQETRLEDAQLSPMAQSFYRDNKRVSNCRLKATGYQLKYPNYRYALEKMWRDQTWQPL